MGAADGGAGRRVRLADDTGLALPLAGRALIGRFVDALWIEDGLAKLTLEAYRRDLTLDAMARALVSASQCAYSVRSRR